MSSERLIVSVQNLDLGYIVEYRVRKETASLAEVKVDIPSAGHWFGGGPSSRLLFYDVSNETMHRSIMKLAGWRTLDANAFADGSVAHACVLSRAHDAAAVAAQSGIPRDWTLLPLRQWSKRRQHPCCSPVAHQVNCCNQAFPPFHHLACCFALLSDQAHLNYWAN